MEEQIKKKKKIVAKRFGSIPYSMMKDFRLNRLDLAVYSYLSMMTNSEGIAYPSFKRMQANLSGIEKYNINDDTQYFAVSRTQLYKSLKNLKDLGWVSEVEDGKYKCNDLAYSREFEGTPRKKRATKAEMMEKLESLEKQEVAVEQMPSNIVRFAKIS